MRHTPRWGLRFASIAALAILLTDSRSFTQSNQSNVTPVNSAPNPYQMIEGWAKLPDGRTWGSTSAVDVDLDGKSIWVAERCGANTCVGSNVDTVFKFDENGKIVKSFGAGLMVFPHGLHVDRDGNIWVVDGQPLG